ncbi:hypothetical protein [Facklamia lactis]|uniref:hypothetical protein n=1 Tax=Facklamia lactis TaxID=2749967 RepID=UPI001F35631B|nr:hypothetical protein [Facklamia lactis]
MDKNKEANGLNFLWCALYACAGFAFELLLVQIEGLFGLDYRNFAVHESVIHWIVTSLFWILIGFLIIYIGKKTTGYQIVERGKPMVSWQYLALLVCFLVNGFIKYNEWDGFKVLKEWESNGPLLFVFQYMYYIAEGFLITLVIIYGQKAFESWFKNKAFPYGGLMLGLIWGLSHAFTKGELHIGILSAFAGFLFSSVYLLVNRDFMKTFLITTLIFII